MKQSMITKKYFSLLGIASISVLVETILILSDTIIAGNMLGESALAAMGVVNSIFSIMTFLSYLVSTGIGILVSYYIGKADEKSAVQYFSSGMIFCYISGFLIMIALILLRDAFIQMYDVSMDVSLDAKAYYSFMTMTAFFTPGYFALCTIVMNEGNHRLCFIETFVNIFCNIIASIFLCKFMGMAGISLATALTTILSTVILISHFFSKNAKRTLYFQWYFSMKKNLEMMKYSFSDASLYLYRSIFTIVINLILTNYSGQTALIAFSLTSVISSFLTSLMDGVGEAMLSIATVYYGEKCFGGLKRILKLSVKTAVVEAIFFALVVELFAPSLIRMIGAKDVLTVSTAATAIRIYAVSFVFTSIIITFSLFYLYTEHTKLAIFIIFFEFFFMQMICSLTGFFFGGITGLWIGYALTSILTLLLLIPILKRIYPNYDFPFLLNKEAEKHSYYREVCGTQEGVMKNQGSLEAFLKNNHAVSLELSQSALIAEEYGMMLVRANAGLNPFHLECTCNISDDAICIIFRDNLQKKEVIDAELIPSSIEDYASSMIIDHIPAKKYVPSFGFNRYVFSIKRKR